MRIGRGERGGALFPLWGANPSQQWSLSRLYDHSLVGGCITCPRLQTDKLEEERSEELSLSRVVEPASRLEVPTVDSCTHTYR